MLLRRPRRHLHRAGEVGEGVEAESTVAVVVGGPAQETGLFPEDAALQVADGMHGGEELGVDPRASPLRRRRRFADRPRARSAVGRPGAVVSAGRLAHKTGAAAHPAGLTHELHGATHPTRFTRELRAAAHPTRLAHELRGAAHPTRLAHELHGAAHRTHRAHEVHRATGPTLLAQESDAARSNRLTHRSAAARGEPLRRVRAGPVCRARVRV